MTTTNKAKQGETDVQNIQFTMRLVMAQNEINAPKSRYNKFGNYNYRSAEDILNAAKPCVKLIFAVVHSLFQASL